MRSKSLKTLALSGAAALLVGLVLVGTGAVAGASLNEQGGQSADHRADAAAHDGTTATGSQAGAHSQSTSQANDDAALNEPQPASNADFTGNGANDHGAYDSTRDGSPSLNGNGDGTAVGRPCAGCVGKADNKNPAGQFPDGTDANAGYECDTNSGIGRTNPAHTGCVATLVPEIPIVVRGVVFTRPAPVVESSVAVRSLAATGAGWSLPIAASTALTMILAGALLLWLPRSRAVS